jgi:hypothetical protein
MHKHVGQHYQSHSKGIKLEKDLELKINELAEYLVEKGVISEHSGLTEYERKAIRFFKENSLIKPSLNKKYQYHSTSEINRIKEIGIKKYLKEKNKTKWYNEPWIGYLIAFITLLFAVYQGLQNESLKKDISSSKLSVDSLRNEVLSHKKKLDSLNVEYALFEEKLSDLKSKIEKKK